MNVSLSSGCYDIISSGTALTANYTSDFEFTVDMSQSFKFNIILKFESNKEEKQRVNQTVANDTITLNCINFDNALGTGLTVPVEVATFQGKKVYLNFWVYSLGEKNLRQILYTIYSER